MATSLRQAVLNNLKCPICKSFFKDPKILTCSHTFCKGCIETLLHESHWRRRDVLLCPMCRGGTWIPNGDVGGQQSNTTVRSLVEAVETQDQEDKSLQREGNYDEKLQVLRSERSDGLQLAQRIRQKESKWDLRAMLPVEGTINGIAISPSDEIAVWCCTGGILIYSNAGSLRGSVLESVQVNDLHFMLDTGYVIRDFNNRISLYKYESEQLDVTFETMDVANGTYGGLTVGEDGLIFVGYNESNTIQVFKPEGGKAIREITCNRFVPWHMFAMTSSQVLVVFDRCNNVHVINDESGAIINTDSIGNDSECKPYPAVCPDNSVIIAWVQHDQGLLSIVHYTKELKYIKNIFTDCKIIKPNRAWYYLRAFKTGEIAFCTSDRLYIFRETCE